jgi:hypothetical protein
MIIEDLVKRYDGLKSQRNVVQESWDAISNYVTPYRGRYFNDQRDESSIEWERPRQIYDSTAVSAHQNLASHIHGALTSPSLRWFIMRFRDEALNDNVEAKQWLEDAGERVYYELQDSNFSLEVNEVYQDLCGPGTASILLDEKPGSGWTGLNFKSVPLKEMCFEENSDGTVERFYRLMQWTPTEIISKFGNDKVPPQIAKAEKDGNMGKHDILFVIYPTGNKVIEVGKRVAASRRPWEYMYILKDSSEMIGDKGSYYEMPAFVPRWRKTSSSIWGNSPAHIAMGDILSLNDARKMQLKMAAKLIDPPLFVSERSILADLDISDGALNVLRDVEGIKFFPTGGNLPVSDHMVTQLQDAVKDYFFVDQLTFPRPQGTPMSATEAMIRQEQLAKLIGPTLGRLQNDMLDPIVSRAFRMLAREGQIPNPPAIVMETDAQFDIEYLGALSRAQHVDEAASIERWVGQAAAMAEIFPDALDVVDPDEMMRYTGRSLSVPAAVMRSKRDVADIRETREADKAQMQAAMIAKEEGDAAKAQGEGQQAMEGGQV